MKRLLTTSVMMLIAVVIFAQSKNVYWSIIMVIGKLPCYNGHRIFNKERKEHLNIAVCLNK